MREARDVVNPRNRKDFNFNYLQLRVQLLTVTRHDRLRPFFVGFVHALFDPLFTVVNPHLGVLSTARSESPRLLYILQLACQRRVRPSTTISVVSTDGSGRWFMAHVTARTQYVRLAGQPLDASRCAASFRYASPRCETLSFSASVISANVFFDPRGWNQASHPKWRSPRGSTRISPAATPQNMWPFDPSQYATQHSA